MIIAKPQIIIFPPTKVLPFPFLCWRNVYIAVSPLAVVFLCPRSSLPCHLPCDVSIYHILPAPHSVQILPQIRKHAVCPLYTFPSFPEHPSSGIFLHHLIYVSSNVISLDTVS